MRTPYLASLLALALPLSAQTESPRQEPAVETYTLWRIETAGIGG